MSKGNAWDGFKHLEVMTCMCVFFIRSSSVKHGRILAVHLSSLPLHMFRQRRTSAAFSPTGLLGVGRCQISLRISPSPFLHSSYWHRWEPCVDLCRHVIITSMKITATLFSWICIREGKEIGEIL